MMHVDFVRPDAAEWQRLIDEIPHDLYHLPQYTALTAEESGGSPGAFLCRGGGLRFLLPLHIREIALPDGSRSSLFDGISPYGYASPVVGGDFSKNTVRSAITALIDLGREMRLVSLFVRLHPLLDIDEAVLEEFGRVVDQGPVVIAKLNQPWELIERDIRKGYRYDIRKLRESGYRVLVNEWGDYPEFVRVYRETMRRVGASSAYLFSETYFANLRERLPGKAHLFTVRDRAERVAGGALCFFHGYTAHYHLSGTAGDYLAVAPTKLLIVEIFRWLRERGAFLLNLGGGLGSSEDSLLQFKAGFSSGRSRYKSWRVIVDRERYDSLMTGVDAPGEGSGYFPAYRNQGR